MEGASSVREVTWLESRFLALRSTSLPTVEEWEPRSLNPSSFKAPWHKTAAHPMPRILLPQPLIPSSMRTLAPHHHTCCVSPRRSQHPQPPPPPPSHRVAGRARTSSFCFTCVTLWALTNTSTMGQRVASHRNGAYLQVRTRVGFPHPAGEIWGRFSTPCR